MALKHALAAGKGGFRHMTDKVEHFLIGGVLLAACIVAVRHGFEKGSDFSMKLVFAIVLVAAVAMEFRACKQMVIQFYQRHIASAFGWCALWVVCAVSTLYVSFGTAASNIEKVSNIHKASSNAYFDSRGAIDRTSKAVKSAQDNVERLQGAANFEISISGIKVTTAAAARELADKAKFDPRWKLTDQCTDIKGQKTREFCDNYRAARAAEATAADASIRSEELKLARERLTAAESEHAAAKTTGANTQTVVSEDQPHLSAVASMFNLSDKQARIADGMQLPMLIQALLSLAAVLMAIEYCRTLPRQSWGVVARLSKMWHGGGDVAEAASRQPVDITPSANMAIDRALPSASGTLATAGVPVTSSQHYYLNDVFSKMMTGALADKHGRATA